MKNSALLLPIWLFCCVAPTFLWGQPSNDECTSAIPLIISDACVPQIFSNVDATQSTIGDIPECFNGGAIDRDVWFTFNVPNNGDIENWEVNSGKGTPNGPNPYYLESHIKAEQEQWIRVGVGIGIFLCCILLLHMRRRRMSHLKTQFIVQPPTPPVPPVNSQVNNGQGQNGLPPSPPTPPLL